jgi:hypothetical protein
MSDSPSTEDEIAKFFRENDDIGADSSLWLRAIRQLVKDGKPIGQLTALAFRGANTGAYPFGVLTQTKEQRVVFWPVLPRNADMIAAEGKNGVADHLILELSNKKTHVTAYDAAGHPSRVGASDLGHKHAWRLHEFENCGLALWFTILVNWPVLLDQELAVQRCMQAPTPADAERRKRVFAQIAAQTKVIDVALPKSANEPAYVYCAVYLVTSQDGEFKFSPVIFPSSHVDDEVEGWPDGSSFEIQLMRLRYEHSQFVLATASPPGSMKHDVTFGLPWLTTGNRT